MQGLGGSITRHFEKWKRYLQSLNSGTKVALALAFSLSARYIGIKLYKKINKMPPGNQTCTSLLLSQENAHKAPGLFVFVSFFFFFSIYVACVTKMVAFTKHKKS